MNTPEETAELTERARQWAASDEGREALKRILADAIELAADSTRKLVQVTIERDELLKTAAQVTETNAKLMAEVERLQIAYVSANEGWPGVKAEIDRTVQEREALRAEVERLNNQLFGIAHEIGEKLPLHVQHRSAVDTIRWFAAEVERLKADLVRRLPQNGMRTAS